MWLLKLVPMHVIIGLILILGLWVLYRLIFKKEVKLSKLLSKKLKKFVKKFKEVDKREQYANFLRSKKYLDFYEKYGLLSKRSKKEIESNLLTCGYENAEGYIINFFKEMHWIVLAIIIIGATNIILTGLIWIMVNEVLMITTILTGVLVIVASLFILAPLVLKAQVKDLKKKFIVNLEEDYPKLFEHLYFYYVDTDRQLLLGDVLKKMTNNIGPEMTLLVKNLISDGKNSEEKALSNASTRYHDSVKIVNLLGKMSRCIGGASLGGEELQSLYNQMIAEEDIKRELSEERRNEIFQLIMMGGIMSMFLSQIVGLLIEMIKEVNLK